MPQLETGVTCIDRSLIQRAGRTVRLLRTANLAVVTAESCTGGLIAAILSQVEGAGKALEGSFVVYSKAQKAKALGVSEDLLRRQGAINAATAEQMMTGALARSNADLALAVTGVLGPDPDEDGNPVGLIYISAGLRVGVSRTRKHQYGHQHHDALRHQVVIDSLEWMEALIQEAP